MLKLQFKLKNHLILAFIRATVYYRHNAIYLLCNAPHYITSFEFVLVCVAVCMHGCMYIMHVHVSVLTYSRLYANDWAN